MERRRRRKHAQADIAAYRAMPQTEDEVFDVDEATRRMIEEEPWESAEGSPRSADADQPEGAGGVSDT
jgi:hypothetical protein